MAMKLIKKTADYKIFMRGDDRYAVQDATGKPVNGEEKVRILVEEELIKVTVPSPKEEAPEAAEAGTDEATDSAEENAEDAAEPEPPAADTETEEPASSEGDEEDEAK